MSNKEGKRRFLSLRLITFGYRRKPNALLKKIIKLAIDKDGVVLDFLLVPAPRPMRYALNEEDVKAHALFCVLSIAALSTTLSQQVITLRWYQPLVYHTRCGEDPRHRIPRPI
ncbi:hypothetical protein KCP74_24870 [Salmonella enterica subsp. enterica]|nr:hypothetical protein KCP74_24870 [Salmonella enterica subsp. enterica]